MHEITLSNIRLPIVSDCGLIAASEPFYHADRSADFNVMIYVTDGTIYVTEDETDYTIKPGELLFLKSGVHHYGKHETARGTRWYYTHFYFENSNLECIPHYDEMHDYIREITIPKKLAVSEDSHAAHMIRKYANDFCTDEPSMLWSANTRLFDILTELAFTSSHENAPRRLSDRICEYLTLHCCEPFSAKALEDEFYLSYKYMAAVFKSERRLTMQQYHTKVRMNTACRLLRSTLMTVTEVAAAVGYNDALYFSRCFRNTVGTSPSLYRRNITSF